jgi:hypothetical protein
MKSMNNEYAENALAQMFQQAQAQFGDAVKSHWFHASEFCPGCEMEVDAMQLKGKEALSLKCFHLSGAWRADWLPALWAMCR